MIEKPPKHLRPATKEWFSGVLAEYQLEPHHIRLLTLAAESWDRCCESREALAAHGLTFTDRIAPRET
jgi:phage terminase small subunit